MTEHDRDHDHSDHDHGHDHSHGDRGHSHDDHGQDHDHSHQDHDHGHSHEDHDHGHSHDDHDHHHHHASGPWTVAVLVVTSSRDGGKDESGERAKAALEGGDHEVAEVAIVDDDEGEIRAAVRERVADDAIDAVVSTGGTGVTPDDVTIDAVGPMLDPELPGIGEYFRRLSHEQIGTAAMLSRATGGVIDGTAVYAFPGSPDAIELGVERVVLPELDHVLGLARR